MLGLKPLSYRHIRQRFKPVFNSHWFRQCIRSPVEKESAIPLHNSRAWNPGLLNKSRPKKFPAFFYYYGRGILDYL